MKPQPFYTPASVYKSAYCLRYSWTAWPSQSTRLPQLSSSTFLELQENWETDGMRLLVTNWEDNRIQLLFSVKPFVSPIHLTARAKGRLQHSLRGEGKSVRFSRKIGFRTIGENNRNQVESYIKNQVSKEHFVDGNFARLLSEFTSERTATDLSLPTKTNSGRYWYDLHLVLVTHLRGKMDDPGILSRLDKRIHRIAQMKGHRISVRSLMPDHLHLALRGNINSSPEEIALDYMNNTSYLMGFPIWQSSYYVGTFGEYDIGAVRAAVRGG